MFTDEDKEPQLPFDGNQCREEFRRWLVRWTKCAIQGGVNANGVYDHDGGGWPCGTCTMALLNMLGLGKDIVALEEHNKPADRFNEVWRAILQIREADLNEKEEVCQKKIGKT